MNILILSRAPFPEGSAPSTYILNVCRTMVTAGHEVTVVGCRRGTKTDFSINGEFEKIRYTNFDTDRHKKPIVYLFDKYWAKYAVYMLSRFPKTDVVFLFGGGKSCAAALFKACRRRGILYGAFNCEWFTPENFSKESSRRYVQDMTGLIPFNAEHADAAIQISTLLTSYFKEHGVKTVMIPNLVDLRDEKWNCRAENIGSEKLKLAYAGAPSVGKDELATVIEAMTLLPEELKKRTELHIWGSDMQRLESYMGEQRGLLSGLADNIFAYGKTKQNNIPRLINGCHFTVLIRKPSLRTNAGFSTKMVESFAAGVPMMANLTGDIGSYLKDGVNGIVVSDESAAACAEAIKRAHALIGKNPEMRKAALKTARDEFDYHKYNDVMKTFLQTIEKPKN